MVLNYIFAVSLALGQSQSDKLKLSEAMRSDDVASVKKLLQQMKEVTSEDWKYLVYTSTKKIVVREGSKVRRLDRDGRMVRLLIERGLDVNEFYEQEPFWFSGARGTVSIPAFKTLLRYVDDINVSRRYARQNVLTERFGSHVDTPLNVELIQCLLEAGANPNVPQYWRPPLLTTAYVGNLEVFKLLLKHKADPKVKNEYGQTTLHVVTLRQTPGNLAVQDYILKNKLAPTDTLFEGETPYAYAKRKGNKAALKVFEKYGVKY